MALVLVVLVWYPLLQVVLFSTLVEVEEVVVMVKHLQLLVLVD
jgi:hypothetical protein